MSLIRADKWMHQDDPDYLPGKISSFVLGKVKVLEVSVLHRSTSEAEWQLLTNILSDEPVELSAVQKSMVRTLFPQIEVYKMIEQLAALGVDS